MTPNQKRSSLLNTATGLAILAVCAACSRETPPPSAQTPGTAQTAPGQPGEPLETREPNGPDFKPAFVGQTRVAGLKSDVELDVT
jgi:aldose sugar dehydrogenase